MKTRDKLAAKLLARLMRVREREVWAEVDRKLMEKWRARQNAAQAVLYFGDYGTVRVVVK